MPRTAATARRQQGGDGAIMRRCVGTGKAAPPPATRTRKQGGRLVATRLGGDGAGSSGSPGDIQTARITQAAAAAARVARVAKATRSHDRSRVLGCRSSPRYRTALSTPSGTTVTTASHSRSIASGSEKVNGACLRRRQHHWRHRRQGYSVVPVIAAIAEPPRHEKPRRVTCRLAC